LAPGTLVNLPREKSNKPGSFCIVKNFPFPQNSFQEVGFEKEKNTSSL
jgi:hypothetical protein